MIPKQIIDKAIEGGWKDTRPQISAVEHEEGILKASIMNDFMNFYNIPVVICDPLFWQALEKALSWKRNIDEETGEPYLADPSEVYAQEVWLDKAHEFFNLLLLTGGDTQSFWDSIMKK